VLVSAAACYCVLLSLRRRGSGRRCAIAEIYHWSVSCSTLGLPRYTWWGGRSRVYICSLGQAGVVACRGSAYETTEASPMRDVAILQFNLQCTSLRNSIQTTLDLMVNANNFLYFLPSGEPTPVHRPSHQ